MLAKTLSIVAVTTGLVVTSPVGSFSQSEASGKAAAKASSPKAKRAPPKAAQPAPIPPPEPFVPTPGFSVKPAEITLPSDVPLGQYRRVIRPFPNWTLICDENLEARRKICNIAQTILGADGSPVFSWSLAAREDGQPIFILRAPASIGEGASIRLDLQDGGPVVPVPVQGCTGTICLAYQSVAQRFRAAVEKGRAIEVSYSVPKRPDAVSFRVPLDGLAVALAAI